jgi:hypothetical protein
MANKLTNENNSKDCGRARGKARVINMPGDLTVSKRTGTSNRIEIQFRTFNHPRLQAQARAALTVALVQAVGLQRNSDAEAWSHSICIAP